MVLKAIYLQIIKTILKEQIKDDFDDYVKVNICDFGE